MSWGSEYNKNSRGPKTEPWGTPKWTGGGDLYLKLATKEDLSDRYEENHSKADPDTPRATASKAEIWTDARKHQLLSSHLQNILEMTTKAGSLIFIDNLIIFIERVIMGNSLVLHVVSCHISSALIMLVVLLWWACVVLLWHYCESSCNYALGLG